MPDYAAELPRPRRRAAGAFYTPPGIVTEVVTETLGRLVPAAGWRSDGSPVLSVLDPAAGDGRFLVASADFLTVHAVRRGFDAEAARRAIVARCLTGVERDPAAAANARRELGPGADVRTGEALLGGVIEDGVWDAVVGNPPWVRSVRMKASDPVLWRALRGKLAATSYREWDLYAAFIERALEWAAPAGEIGLCVPSRWFTAAFAAPLRERLARARAVRKIVDFGGRQLFAGATTYPALVYLTRAGAAGVEVVRDGERGTASLPAGTAPWVLASLASGRRGDLVERLRRAGPPLGAIARIAKGAGSNADPVFLLEPRAGRLWSPALGTEVEIEAGALVPCLRGRDVGVRTATVRRLALLPYVGSELVDFAEVAGRWPLAAAYLERCRPLLEARERGRFAGGAFHRWGRPQNLAWLADRAAKIVVPDAAREGRAALDAAGTLVIDTAYAIRPRAGEGGWLDAILDTLASPIAAAWLRATGIPLRGGYFRMKTAYLSSLPIAGGDGDVLARYGVTASELGELGALP